MSKSNTKYRIEDLTRIDLIQPTCKVNVKNKQSCQQQYTDHTMEFDTNTKMYKLLCKPSYYCNPEKSDISYCYDQVEKRIPSYCDRILGLVPKDMKYIFTSEPNLDILTHTFTNYSDHNPIYNTVTIKPGILIRPSNYYMQKYLKYKTKYINLKNILANNI